MFNGPELRVVLEAVAEKTIAEATALPDATLLGGTVDSLVDSIMSGVDMDVPVLHSEDREITHGDSGEPIVLHVPFTGTRGLFENQPNLMGPVFPEGTVTGSEVVVELGPADSFAADRADRWAASVQLWLNAVGHDVGVWRADLERGVRQIVERRRSQAQEHQDGLAAVGIPIRRRDDAPATYTQDAIVRRQPVQATPPSAAPGEAPADEPTLDDAFFDHIVSVIGAAGRAMERSPATYAGWGEEDRRQVLILMLNTHYSGKVFAEAFNGDGDTDILIRVEDRNLFIGECKFYAGPQSVTDTLAQIFGYATWRDVKLAMIFFVNRVNFSEAVARIRQTVEQATEFRSWLPTDNAQETEFRAQMAWPGDHGRLVTMHVAAFHTPAPSDQ